MQPTASAVAKDHDPHTVGHSVTGQAFVAAGRAMAANTNRGIGKGEKEHVGGVGAASGNPWAPRKYQHWFLLETSALLSWMEVTEHQLASALRLKKPGSVVFAWHAGHHVDSTSVRAFTARISFQHCHTCNH
eukprot:1161909-Pelagomonas_calceolata.AAC.16